MPKLIDLTGKKFNKLTVLERAENKGKKVRWKCECECGNIVIVDGANLRSGVTKSCGCIRGKDLTNQKFHRLTAIRPTKERTTDRNIIWECKCDCGTVCLVDSSSLISGNTKSCGCLNREQRVLTGQANKKDLTNMRFGKLFVEKDSGERKDNKVLWQCICDCGNKVKITTSSLLSGTQSCGCLKSKGEQRIASILCEHNIPFETQKTFDSCRFENGYLAKFDFYVDKKYLIEFDGIQHFSTKQGGWNNPENLKKTQERDAIKTEWCSKNNIPLIRIPYWKLSTLTIEDLIL